jgi:hypothetical protein
MTNINPYLVTGITASGKALTPVPLREKAFDEGWLQELLFRHPSILPIGYVDEDYAPLVSIGREIASIDDLFVSPSGSLTLVETKLWRNPQAHRTVVAQILEYAKTLASWTYGKLDQAVSADLGRRTGESLSIFRAVKKQVRNFDLSEIEFQSKVQEGLSNGRFALLIVGDRIFPEATQLAEVIRSTPHLQFSFGFVELRCYRLEKDSNWPLVVVPNFVAKTREFTRAVVKVVYEEKRPDVQVEAVEDEVKRGAKTNLREFTASLPSNIKDHFKTYIERWIKAGYAINWGKVGFSLRIQWKERMATFFDAYPDSISIILTEKWVREYELPEETYQSYRDELMKSPTLGGYIAAGRRYVGYENLATDDVALILHTTDRFVAELRKKDSSSR